LNKSKILFQSKEFRASDVTAEFIASFITSQLALPIGDRSDPFKRGLSFGVLNLIESALLKNKIKGLKISCRGRWSKTATGRKQILNVSTGNLGLTSLKSKIQFSSSQVTTRYGVCSVHVWFAL